MTTTSFKQKKTQKLLILGIRGQSVVVETRHFRSSCKMRLLKGNLLAQQQQERNDNIPTRKKEMDNDALLCRASP